MVVDTSALAAIVFDEPDRETYTLVLGEADEVLVSAATHVEATLVIEGRLGPAGRAQLDAVIRSSGARLVGLDIEQARVAQEGWRRYGKGRHRAGLNLGDCFSYALAITTGQPLLFKGDDFRHTDVRDALAAA